jgi:hypothetical protein
VPTLLLLGRMWGLHVALPLAALEGLTALWWWEGGATIPTIDRAVPMPAVLPPLLAISIAWVLVERWPDALATAARSPQLIRLGRYAAAQAICLAAALGASALGTDHGAVALTVIGVSAAGLLAPVLQGWLWMPLVMAGYAWLQLAARQYSGDYLHNAIALAIASSVIGGSVYVRWPRPPHE